MPWWHKTRLGGAKVNDKNEDRHGLTRMWALNMKSMLNRIAFLVFLFSPLPFPFPLCCLLPLPLVKELFILLPFFPLLLASAYLATRIDRDSSRLLFPSSSAPTKYDLLNQAWKTYSIHTKFWDQAIGGNMERINVKGKYFVWFREAVKEGRVIFFYFSHFFKSSLNWPY